MTKKNKKAKVEHEPAEDQVNSPATAPAEGEAGAQVQAAESESQASGEVSVDDLLDDVRRSLIEDDAQNVEKKSGWLSRIKKGFQKDPGAAVSAPDEPAGQSAPEIPWEQPKDDPYLEQIDELIEMLEPPAESKAAPEPDAAAEPEPAPPPEPEPMVNMEELKKRVFSPRAGGEFQEISEVRAVALEGDEEVFVEVEAKKEDPALERRKAFENSLKPYRRYIYFVTAFLGIVTIVVVLALMAPAIYNSALFSALRPASTPTAGNLPHPVAMSLPGGLNFNLGRGMIQDGEWDPRGPEWLVGTEICRWVAIPWSRQLEAVVRTLTPEDTIELVMNTDDRVQYNVFSIQELTLEEMQELDQNSPCLLLVLAEQDAEKRWVVTAKP